MPTNALINPPVSLKSYRQINDAGSGCSVINKYIHQLIAASLHNGFVSDDSSDLGVGG